MSKFPIVITPDVTHRCHYLLQLAPTQVCIKFEDGSNQPKKSELRQNQQIHPLNHHHNVDQVHIVYLVLC